MAGLRENNGTEHLLGSRFRIGRGSSNQLILAQPDVSSSHAIVRHEHGAFVLEDQGSRNGTWLQRGTAEPKRVVEPTPLEGGDVIRIGSSQLVFDPNIEDWRETTEPFGSTLVGHVVPVVVAVPRAEP